MVVDSGPYAVLVSMWMALGIGVTAIAAYLTQSWVPDLVAIIALLVVSIIGIIIALVSDSSLISFIGFVLLVVPTGMLLGPFVALYTEASVFKIFFVTTGLAVVLGVVGALCPIDLAPIGSVLFGVLGMLLVGYFYAGIATLVGIPIDGALTWLDWIGVVLFSIYIIYDWNRAMNIPHTVDNSVDSAMALYLDFINLFIRLLELFGEKKESDT